MYIVQVQDQLQVLTDREYVGGIIRYTLYSYNGRTICSLVGVFGKGGAVSILDSVRWKMTESAIPG